MGAGMRGNGIWKVSSIGALSVLALGLVLAPPSATSKMAQGADSQSPADSSVPAYHTQAPRGALPATMNPELFPDPVVQNAYAIAAKIKKTLYQQPCYCHCDRSQGHASLLDCFASKHGAECGVCMREAIYSYEQTHKGKSAVQIRAGIERGEWRDVDMSKYTAPVAAK